MAQNLDPQCQARPQGGQWREQKKCLWWTTWSCIEQCHLRPMRMGRRWRGFGTHLWAAVLVEQGTLFLVVEYCFHFWRMMRKRVFWEFGFCSCNGNGDGGRVWGLELGRWVDICWVWWETRGLIGWPCFWRTFSVCYILLVTCSIHIKVLFSCFTKKDSL